MPCVETVIFHPLPGISNCTSHHIFVKFIVRFLYRKCWSSRSFIKVIPVAFIHYRGADKSLARPTSQSVLFDGENISFDTSLGIYEGWNFNSGNYLFTTDTK